MVGPRAGESRSPPGESLVPPTESRGPPEAALLQVATLACMNPAKVPSSHLNTPIRSIRNVAAPLLFVASLLAVHVANEPWSAFTAAWTQALASVPIISLFSRVTQEHIHVSPWRTRV